MPHRLMWEREEIVMYGKELLKRGLTRGTGGNFSVYNRQAGLVAISPSGIDYKETQPEDVVIVNLDGEVVDGRRKPSSEIAFHLIFYQRRDDINAVAHTHSTFAKTLASLRWDLPAVSYLLAYAGPDVRCAEYATYGTPELAENAFEAMKDRRAVLLANHGLIAGGRTLKEAFNIAEQIEFCAEIYWRAKSVGEPVLLPDDEMARVMDRFKTYGQK